MKRQRNILIGELTICLVFTIVIYSLIHFVYADVANLMVIPSLPLIWVIVTLINWKKEVDTTKPRVRWFTIIVLIITATTLLALKPEYTYKQGIEIVKNTGFSNLSETEEKSLFASELPVTEFIWNSYLFEAEKNNEKYYVLVSPINGKIQAEKVGVGNYIDMYRNNKVK